jgi:hypothetical protein
VRATSGNGVHFLPQPRESEISCLKIEADAARAEGHVTLRDAATLCNAKSFKRGWK